MSIAIIIATHGNAAQSLLNTTEMLIGKQANVVCIDFEVGVGTEELMEKYKTKISTELASCSEILFLVDIWGGSPFNAANKMASETDTIEVISGVNIPMLIETFMARDTDISLAELATIAVTSAQEGIKALKYPAETEVKTAPIQTTVATNNPDGSHMKIGLARVDDRLIHGQVVTRWTKETKVNRIIVVSDEVAQDEVRSSLLKQVAPPGVSAHVTSVDKMIRVYDNPEYANDTVMLLFTHPKDALRLIEAGVDIKSLNIGGISYSDGKHQLTNAVFVNEDEIKAFKQLHDLNIELEVRKVASDSRENIMDLLTKNQLI